ncbi:acyltransferase family protein, partial [Streptomyces tendae]
MTGLGAVFFRRRRIARIYPVHLVTAGAALLLACTLAPTTRPKGSGELFANLLLVSSWKHDWWQALSPVSWSLCCEAFFYMLFPALFAVARRLGPRALFAAAGLCVAVVIALPWAGQHYALGWDLYASPLLRLPEFVLGIVLARLVWLDVWRGPGVGVSLVIAVAGYSLTSVVPADYHHAACTVLGFGSLIAAGAVADLNGTWSVWRGRRSVRLGELSFAFYMIHILV